MNQSAIIWDWNGTLLNDLDFCIATINQLLHKRNLPLLSRKTYKEVFLFPVKNYYEAIGFDFSKENFAVPAREFIDLYDTNHDFEVAEALGIGSVLIADGHQSKKRLKSTGTFVLNTLFDLMERAKNNFERNKISNRYNESNLR